MRSGKSVIIAGGLFLCFLLSRSPVYGDPITIPAGLAPGSIYYLAFVTAGTTTALSSNITDYNAFRAALGQSIGLPGYDPGLDWNGDGVIDITDRNAFRSRLGSSLP